MYTDAVAKLHKTARNLMVLKGIPWFIQATLSDEGFVLMEDLATRWDSPDRARETAPGELGFAPNNHHYTDVTSRLIAARMFQVVHAAQRYGSWGACNSGTRATHARGHCPESHGLVRTGTAGEGLGGEDQTHQTQAGPARKRPADEAPVQALRRRQDRLHPHEVPGKRTPGTRRTAMEDRQEDHGGWLGPGGRGAPTREDAHGSATPSSCASSRFRSSASSTSPGMIWRAGTSGSMVRTSGAVFPRQRTTSWPLPNATHGGRFTRRCMRATPSRRPYQDIHGLRTTPEGQEQVQGQGEVQGQAWKQRQR